MFFHGSPSKLEPGTILVPGAELGTVHNGACSDYVYMTTSTDWSMSQLHEDDRLDCIDPLDYALKDAYLWGVGATDNPSYVHVVEPLDEPQEDPHTDAGPAARRVSRAKVVAVLEAEGMSAEAIGPLLAQLKAWQQELKLSA